MLNLSHAGGLCAAFLIPTLLVALVGCGGGADPAPSSGAGAVSQSGPTGGTATGAERRNAESGDGGAGGGSTSAPAAPTLRLAFVGRQLQFSWSTARSATHYKLFANADGASGFRQVGADLAADSTGTALDIAAHRHDRERARYLLEACNSAGCTPSNQATTFGVGPQAVIPAPGARGRFAQPATPPGSAEVGAGHSGTSNRVVPLPSTPALAAASPAPSHQSAGASSETNRACVRCPLRQ